MREQSIHVWHHYSRILRMQKLLYNHFYKKMKKHRLTCFHNSPSSKKRQCNADNTDQEGCDCQENLPLFERHSAHRGQIVLSSCIALRRCVTFTRNFWLSTWRSSLFFCFPFVWTYKLTTQTVLFA